MPEVLKLASVKLACYYFTLLHKLCQKILILNSLNLKCLGEKNYLLNDVL